MTGRLELWPRFADPAYWWMDAMVALWALFMIAVFVIEPIVEPRLARAAERDPAGVLQRLFLAHCVLLAAAAVTIVGAVAGARGGLFS